MWVSKVIIKGVRCFKNEEVSLSKGINVIVGENNTGKSTILHAIRYLQDTKALMPDDKRIGSVEGEVTIVLEDPEKKYFGGNSRIYYNLRDNQITVDLGGGRRQGTQIIPGTQPDNFIYPYLSRRKVAEYDVIIGTQNSTAVTGNLSKLYAKVDRLTSPAVKTHKEYIEACERVLGFIVLAADVPDVQNGKKHVLPYQTKLISQ